MRMQHSGIALVSVLVVAVTSPWVEAQTGSSLESIENQFAAAFELNVENGHLAKVAELDGKYLGALEKALQGATQGGRLKEALALREEVTRVKEKGTLPETDEGVEPALAKLRATYREQLGKLMAARQAAAGPIVKKFEEALAAHESALTKAGKLDEAAAVLAYREGGVAAKLLGQGGNGVAPVAAGKPGPANGGKRDPVLAAATKEKPFVNSLGMTFVPVPDTEVLFCIHETRFRDYAAYAEGKPAVNRMWKVETRQGVALPAERIEDQPVINVSWDEASAFCKWLSETEGRTYRLPSDQEWSMAAGLGRKELWRRNDTPESVVKDMKEFPWGTEWPPPKGAGNYGDQSWKAKVPNAGLEYLADYDDGVPTTAPVMSFLPSKFGLCDMGGNVWEWTEDWWNAEERERVSRGGGWQAFAREYLLSATRGPRVPEFQGQGIGFRVVVKVSGGR